MNGTLQHYCGNRLFEWVMTLALLMLGVLVVQWPDALAASAFRYILWIVAPVHLGIFYIVVGGFRIAALIANGSWLYGPYIRSVGALAGAVIWGQMDLALLLLIPHAGTPPSPGIPVYFCLIIGELISVYRALATRDCRHGLVR